MTGKGVSDGIAIGRAWICREAAVDYSQWERRNAAEELEVFGAVKARLLQVLGQRSRDAREAGREAHGDILEAHGMMLDDPELQSGIAEALKSGMSLPEAVHQVLEGFASIMESMDDEYLKQRAQDYRDIRKQVTALLFGIGAAPDFQPGDQWILVAQDFTPSDISYGDNPAVKGFLAQDGAVTTHFSILTRIAGIPSVVQFQNALTLIQSQDMLIIDGSTGTVIINPEPEIVTVYKERQQRHTAFVESLKQLKGTSAVTSDGCHCHLEGNIAGHQDVQELLENGAEGIGLFRTEFLYMDRTSPPDEDEQTAVYGKVLTAMGGKPTVIRTLDVGGDKELPYLGIPKEENPFLGFRAVRYCLAHTALFKTQLRALLRASVHGNLQIMVPMISGIEEVRSVRLLLEECRNELAAEGEKYSDAVALGIMVEVPAAAAMASILAEEVDFFSIGTNDLIQYVMAADRMNPAVGYLYTPYHPAFIRILQTVISGAHAAGIPVAMCGELAGDPEFTPVLVGLGLDGYSMNAGAMLAFKQRVRTLEAAACKTLVQKLLALRTEAEIRSTVKDFLQEYPYATA